MNHHPAFVLKMYWLRYNAHAHTRDAMEALQAAVNRLAASGSAHLRATGETYGQHAREALCCSWWLLCAALAALIHALVPGCFTNTASSLAAHVVAAVAARRKQQQHHSGVTPEGAPMKAH